MIRLAIRSEGSLSEGKGGRQTGEGLTVFRCGLPAYTTHADKKKIKTSLLNLLNHKEQIFPNRKKVSAEAKFQQMPQTSISTYTTFSDMRVNLTSGHVPHSAREYRLIRSSGLIEGNATIYTEIARTATILPNRPKTLQNRETV